jgi:hypothetical protein
VQLAACELHGNGDPKPIIAFHGRRVTTSSLRLASATDDCDKRLDILVEAEPQDREDPGNRERTRGSAFQRHPVCHLGSSYGLF